MPVTMAGMVPLVVDPNDYDKRIAYNVAVTHVIKFLELNCLEDPSEILTKNPYIDGDERAKHNKWREKGWYEFGTTKLYVNLKRSRCPVKSPGFQWSYTGYKADLTAPGVLAHEVGHHVHNMIARDVGLRKTLELIKNVKKEEPNVSSYEPNAYEAYAEAIRLFILNPNFLRIGRPLRWSLLTEEYGLKPLHDEEWQNILKNAHPKLIAAAENWIKAGTRKNAL